MDSDFVKLLLSNMRDYDGRELEITITDKQSWTNRMNRLFHGLIRAIYQGGAVQYWSMIRKAPESFEEVKTWVKVELCGAKVERIGEMVWIESWTNFSRKRACASVDNVIQYCVSMDVDIDSEKLEFNDLKGA